jgi:hypothetical protein
LSKLGFVGLAVLLGQLVERVHVLRKDLPAELPALDPSRRVLQHSLSDQLALDCFSIRGAFLPAAPSLPWFRSAPWHG